MNTRVLVQGIDGYQVYWGFKDSDWREIINTLRYYRRFRVNLCAVTKFSHFRSGICGVMKFRP